MSSIVTPTGSTNQPGAAALVAPSARPPAQTRAEADEFRRLLVGPARGAMNLGAVRDRAQELRNSLDEMARALAFNAHNIRWSDILDKYAVMQVQYHNLTEQLWPLLKHYVVHPKSVNQATAPVLPLLLSSKALPEMEAERTELLQTHGMAAGAASAPERFQSLTAASDALNALVDYLTVQGSASGSGQLDVRSARRREIAGAVRSGPAPPLRRPGNQQAMQHGKKTESADKLLAAVSKGSGLKR